MPQCQTLGCLKNASGEYPHCKKCYYSKRGRKNRDNGFFRMIVHAACSQYEQNEENAISSKICGVCNKNTEVDSRIELDIGGRWSSSGDVDSFANRRLSSRARMPSPLRLLTNLAQAVMKKRTYGMSAPVFTPFNLETLNDFEAIAMMDLVRRVCKEESIQFILGISSTNVNSMIKAIETPRLSIYET